MKINKKFRSFYIAIFILPTVFLVAAAFNSIQIDTKQLEKAVREKISNYYLEEFKIAANPEGVVTVEGDVGTLYDKLKIGDLVSQVVGVSGINNKIEVNTILTADDIIKANIENELQLNNIILEPEKIIVEVNQGTVTLSGTVSYFREKIMAQSIASWQDGVIDMKSNIILLSPAAAKNDDNLKGIVSDILKRDFALEDNVKFDINNGVVNIYGSVKSLYAKDHIQEEIQLIIGVKDVVNEIVLEKNSDE